MRSAVHSNKTVSTPSKSKKILKEKEKKRVSASTAEGNKTSSEKGCTTKESNTRLYAGIDSDVILNYLEQSTDEHLQEDALDVLTEDINYRLRYIINDALIKARISSKNSISSSDIKNTFNNLKLDKVYGASKDPNWIVCSDPSLNANYLVLEDEIVNIVDIAGEENIYYQNSECEMNMKWIPENNEVTKALKNYFSTMCLAVVGSDVDMCRMALIDISRNPRIGPITEWFYNFSYILLSKDISYDCLTLRALDLINVLERSPCCRINVSERQLKFLVRLILQRLVKSSTTNELIRPLCTTLAVLCIRHPLRQFVIMKILQRVDEIFENYALPVITIANCFGSDAIQILVLPKLDLLLEKTIGLPDSVLINLILESYYILHKEDLIDNFMCDFFSEHFGDSFQMFHYTFKTTNDKVKKEIDVCHVKGKLLRTQRQIEVKQSSVHYNINEVFEITISQDVPDNKIQNENATEDSTQKKITIGKTSLLLPVFKKSYKKYTKCYDHSLISYNL